MILNFVTEGNSIARCRIMEASAPSVLSLLKKLVLLDGSKEIVSVIRIIKYIRGRSIKIVQSFASLVKV